MKWVEHVQTRDGKLHHDYLRAKAHAESVYGEAMCRMAKKLVSIEKYGKMTEFLDAHLHEFTELIELKKDMELEKREEDGIQ